MTRQSIILAAHEARRLQSGTGSVLAVSPIEPQPDRVANWYTWSPPGWNKPEVSLMWKLEEMTLGLQRWAERCPYPLGARLAVRETWSVHPDGDGILYRATDPGWDDNNTGLAWRSASTMPMRYSRATVEVVRVECRRAYEITEEEAQRTGITFDDPEGLKACNLKRFESEYRWSVFKDWEQRHGARYPWAGSWAWYISLEIRRA